MTEATKSSSTPSDFLERFVFVCLPMSKREGGSEELLPVFFPEMIFNFQLFLVASYPNTNQIQHLTVHGQLGTPIWNIYTLVSVVIFKVPEYIQVKAN